MNTEEVIVHQAILSHRAVVSDGIWSANRTPIWI